MKQIFLSTLLCLAGYAGAYASNEVVNDLVISQEIETVNSKASSLDSLDAVEFNSNCRTFVMIITPDGFLDMMIVDSNVGSYDACMERGNLIAEAFASVGFNIFHHGSYYNPDMGG